MQTVRSDSRWIFGSTSQKTYKKQDMVREHRNTAVAFLNAMAFLLQSCYVCST